MKYKYVVGWIIGDEMEGRTGEHLFAGEYGESVTGVSLKRAKELQNVLAGSKIYRLVEVKKKKTQ